MKKIKKWWNTPITWGSSVEMSLVVTAIGMAIMAVSWTVAFWSDISEKIEAVYWKVIKFNT